MVPRRKPRDVDVPYAARLPRPSRIGLVRYGSMSPRPCVDSIDLGSALLNDPCEVAEGIVDAAHSVAGRGLVIIDLQGSRGGTCAHAAAICASLLPPTVKDMPFKHRDGALIGFDPWDWPRDCRSRAATRFIVLIDSYTASASEHIAGVLRILPSTMFVGARTCGAEFSVRIIRLPEGLEVRFGRSPGVWSGLPSVEGRGIPPCAHVAVDEAVLANDGISAAIRDFRRRSMAAAL